MWRASVTPSPPTCRGGAPGWGRHPVRERDSLPDKLITCRCTAWLVETRLFLARACVSVQTIDSQTIAKNESHNITQHHSYRIDVIFNQFAWYQPLTTIHPHHSTQPRWPMVARR